MADSARPAGVAPKVVVRPAAIRENAAAIRSRFDGRLVGVTKGACGDPAVAGAMLSGGVAGIADSRTRNLERIRDRFDAETTQLVGPMPDAADRVVATADRSLNTEPTVIAELGAAARRRDRIHDVVLMVDVGDRREGVLPEDLASVFRAALDCEGVRVAGVGANLGCFGGVLPTADRIETFVDAVERAEAEVGERFDVVSGGSTVTLPLVEAGTLPDRVNELRVGEAILLGTDVARDRTIPYLRGDAFELRAAVVECKRKPSTPEGERGRTPDGERPTFEDRGRRERALLALGEQDAVLSELDPVADGIRVLGGSSDHTVLDVTDADREVEIGDVVGFRPGYRALVRAFTSEYVGREVEGATDDEGEGPNGADRDVGGSAGDLSP